MAVYPRGDSFLVRIRRKGAPPIARTYKTRVEAEAFELECLAAIKLGKPLPGAEAGTTKANKIGTIQGLAEWCDGKYWSGNPQAKSGADTARNAYLFAKWVGPNLTPAAALTEENMRAYAKYRSETLRRSGSTVNRHLTTVGKLCGEAVKLRLIEAKPERPIFPEGDGRDRVYTEAEEELMFAVVEQWGYNDHADLFTFLIETGCRLGETELLPWSAFAIEGLLSIPKLITHPRTRKPYYLTKGKKGRMIALSDRAKAVIERLRVTQGNRHGPFEWHLDARRETRTLWDRLRGHFEWMDEHTVIHTFRHTCASRLVREGAALEEIMQWLGHTDIKMTLRYAKYAPKNKVALATLLNRRRQRSPEELVDA